MNDPLDLLFFFPFYDLFFEECSEIKWARLESKREREIE